MKIVSELKHTVSRFKVQCMENGRFQTKFRTLKKILSDKHIKSVYQPIVSLIDGQIFGFEALSRINNEKFNINIEQMFEIAGKTKKTWELEILCREKALQNAVNMSAEKKLFLNVNPNIIYDENFREEFTTEHLNEYGFDSNVIFEITERVAITDNEAFLDSIEHYRDQNFGIAIDDVGSGFSGLNVIASIKPNIIKIDMNLIRNIDKDEVKLLLCKYMVDFGKSAGIKLVAEGIETEEELKTLIKLKVDFGQGYFLGFPQESFENIAPEKIDMIKNCNKTIN